MRSTVRHEHRGNRSLCYNKSVHVTLDWGWGACSLHWSLTASRELLKANWTAVFKVLFYVSSSFIFVSFLSLVFVWCCNNQVYFKGSQLRINLLSPKEVTPPPTERQTKGVWDRTRAIHNWSSSQDAGLDSRGCSHSGRSALIFSCNWFLFDTFI